MHFFIPLADINSHDIAPMIATAFIMAVPIIAILTAHQRKMAEIIHGKINQVDPNSIHPMVAQELQNLRGEVNQLRDQVNQQALESDSLRSQMGSVTPMPQQVRPPEVPIRS